MASSSVRRTAAGWDVSARGGVAGCRGGVLGCCAAAKTGSSATENVARAKPFFMKMVLKSPARGPVANQQNELRYKWRPTAEGLEGRRSAGRGVPRNF